MDELINLLGEVSGSFQARLQEVASLRAVKLAPFQARLLTIIGRRPGCSQQELAGWTARDKAQVARTIKELDSLGLLTRAAHESDWRSHRLGLTEEGLRTSTRLLADREALGAVVTDGLSADQRQIVIDALKSMRDRLDAADQDNGPRGDR